MKEPVFRAGDGCLHLRCRVIPRSRLSGFDGVRGDEVLVRLAAPPVDGKANAALRRLLADHFRVPTSQVTVERGERNRSKVVRIDGATRLTPELGALLLG